MKFLVNREAIAEVLAFASDIVKVRTPKPALTAVRLIAHGKRLTLVATDMDISMRWALTSVDVLAEGEALIPAAKLSSVINSIADDTLTVESALDVTEIKSAAARFKLLGYPPADLPPVAEFVAKDSDLIMPGADLARMMEQTDYAMATEVGRYAMCGLLFERLKGRLNLVSTNGHFLAATKRDTPAGEEFGHPVGARMVKLLQRLLGTMSDAVCRVQLSHAGALFAVASEADPTPVCVLRGLLPEGSFPPYQDIWPKDCDKKASVNRKRLMSAIQQAQLLTNEESRGVRLAFSKDHLEISSRAPAMGEATIDVPCEYAHEELQIGFNPEYLIKALKPIEAETVTLEMSRPSKPLLLKGDSGAMAVIMPANLS